MRMCVLQIVLNIQYTIGGFSASLNGWYDVLCYFEQCHRSIKKICYLFLIQLNARNACLAV